METLTQQSGKNGLTANALKLIAIIAMTIDHSTWTFFPGYRTETAVLLLHIIGRLTAPIMMYFVVEGYYHTRNVKRYVCRMFAFALVAHVPYMLMVGNSVIPFQDSMIDQTSLMWTLALGLLALAVVKSEHPKLKPWHKYVIVTVCMAAAFCANWSTPAAAAILLMGLNRGNFGKQMLWLSLCIGMYAAIYAVAVDMVYGVLQMAVVLSFPLLYRYNGQRGGWRGMKWFFYAYYPAHMAILGIVKIVLLTA